MDKCIRISQFVQQLFIDPKAAQQASQIIQGIRRLSGARPIIFDREFSYRELLNNLVEEGVHFVIRLNLGANPPLFYYDAVQKHRLRLWVNTPKSIQPRLTC